MRFGAYPTRPTQPKREAFRAAFADFDIDTVASLGEADVERLLEDSGIVRNRDKIVASIENARHAREAIEKLVHWRG